MNKNLRTTILIAIYAAVFFVLSKFATINLGYMKVTFQNLPLYLGAITLGPVAGGLIGFIGSLLSQIVYGFTATTPIWLLPQTLIGILVGFVYTSKKFKTNQPIRFCVYLVFFQILLTIFNTLALLADSLITGYYTFVTIFGALVLRIMMSLLVSIVYMLILPVLINLQKKIH